MEHTLQEISQVSGESLSLPVKNNYTKVFCKCITVLQNEMPKPDTLNHRISGKPSVCTLETLLRTANRIRTNYDNT